MPKKRGTAVPVKKSKYIYISDGDSDETNLASGKVPTNGHRSVKKDKAETNRDSLTAPAVPPRKDPQEAKPAPPSSPALDHLFDDYSDEDIPISITIPDRDSDRGHPELPTPTSLHETQGLTGNSGHPVPTIHPTSQVENRPRRKTRIVEYVYFAQLFLQLFFFPVY